MAEAVKNIAATLELLQIEDDLMLSIFAQNPGTKNAATKQLYNKSKGIPCR